MHEIFTSGISDQFSYNFHLEQANITLLRMGILAQFWKFVGGLEGFSD